MPRPGNVKHVQVMLLDQPVEMDPDETLAGVGPPMPEQAALDMLGPKRLLEQRIIAQVKHPDAQIVAGPPVRVDQLDLLGRKVRCHLAPRFVPLCPAGFECLPNSRPAVTPLQLQFDNWWCGLKRRPALTSAITTFR